MDITPATARRLRPQDVERLKDAVKRWLDRRSAVPPGPDSQATLQGLRREAALENRTMGNTNIWSLQGGRSRLEAEFDRLGPTNVRTVTTRYG